MELTAAIRSFLLVGRVENKSPTTTERERYVLDAFSRRCDRPLEEVTRLDVRAFVAECFERGHAPSTVHREYGVLRRFFNWCVEEGELDQSPMKGLRPPLVPEVPVPKAEKEQLEEMLRQRLGKTFGARRDTAILLVLADTGIRRGELASLCLGDVDNDLQCLTVMGKGRRPRVVPYTKRTALALDRYLRVRGRHKSAELPWLWLGQKGRLTDAGVRQVLRRLGGPHPHQFRHAFAHEWLSRGGNETDLMRLTGWKSRQMLSRYGASAADQRAQEAYRRVFP